MRFPIAQPHSPWERDPATPTDPSLDCQHVCTVWTAITMRVQTPCQIGDKSAEQISGPMFDHKCLPVTRLRLGISCRPQKYLRFGCCALGVYLQTQDISVVKVEQIHIRDGWL